MTAGCPGIPDADALARAAEAFVLTWSSMPADLPEKISASQLRALVAVQRSEVTTVTALARDLGALPSSATRLCDRLVAAGYLDRSPDTTNRRFHAVRLTPAGERLLEVLQRHRSDAIAAVLARMDGRARDQLVAGLAAFAAESGALRGTQAGPASRAHLA
jgi:DNA-binding MarR family transcriptional regulator